MDSECTKTLVVLTSKTTNIADNSVLMATVEPMFGILDSGTDFTVFSLNLFLVVSKIYNDTKSTTCT